jgi:hypothetical protein
MMRIRCELWGCWCDENCACPRCGAALYDADFVQIGKLQWVRDVRSFLHGAYKFTNRHCDVCRRRIWFTRNAPCCSRKCYDQWIPF